MANTVTTTTVLDGVRRFAVLVTIVGDGSGEETNTVIVDRSAFAPTTETETVLERVTGHLSGFSARLSFDASTDLVVAQLPDGYPLKYNFCNIGGISSGRAGAGANGDILITTSSLGSGDRGTILLELRKQ